MAYKRKDGRKLDEMRPMSAEVGVIPRAQGSARFKIGKTEALAAVYGPRELYPRFMQDPEKGLLRINYNMMPFSGSGDRVRPGTNRRSKEISMVMEKALRQVVNLKAFPNAVVDVFIELPQTDAGTRCAAICAASMALADAGIIMKDLVNAISVGKCNGEIILDLDYDEDSAEDGVDIPMAMIHHTKEITLLQMDGVISKEEILKASELAKKACDEIYEVQKIALKKKFEIGE
jgi:exosome complex component RRP41